MNIDGIPDIVTANQFDNTASVLINNGNGTFAAPINAAVGSTPFSVAVGDFNGDGKPDVAVANEASNTVSVLIGNGDGTLQPAVNYAVGANPLSVTVGDSTLMANSISRSLTATSACC